VQRYFERRGPRVNVAFCPERVAQGRVIRELRELPQIISAFSQQGLDAARAFFAPFAPKTVVVEPMEAELAKLFSNAYRYIQFATTNQFYQIAESHGLDYDRIYRAMVADYPRLSGLPSPGFAAGPCLFKDTLQLAAFSRQSFSLGLAAVWVNEGLPEFVVDQLRQEHDLGASTVGILGMAFKPEVDDIRDSLSYKLRRLLRIEAQRVLCHDPYVKDPTFSELSTVINESDVLIVATPHQEYRGLALPASKVVVDLWKVVDKG
jgi:UDP-N-acetyl-D-mannosaminuronic acid dehydrogenase